MELTVRSLMSENEELKTIVSEKDNEIERFQKSFNRTTAELQDLTLLNQQMESSLTEAQFSENSYKQELSTVSKKLNSTEQQLGRKNTVIAELKSKIDEIHKKYEESKKEKEAMNTMVARKEDPTDQADTFESKPIDDQLAIANSRQKIAKLQSEMYTLNDKLKGTTAERDMYRRKLDEVNEHYNKMYHEANVLVYRLEKKELECNTLKIKVAQKPPIIETPVQQITLEKEIQSIKDEKANLQKSWLKLQQDNMNLQSQIGKLVKENNFFVTQLGIKDTIREKTDAEIDADKKEIFEKNIAITKLTIELQKLRPVIEQLKNRNVFNFVIAF
ncbi:hypothetical protein BKA69DRAFT_1073316 [Paraphysoderma sedebokerense]|nr:hypothetical protein BKA69DRAFT_1073316 [Paraphysoderma sedebokerense]